MLRADWIAVAAFVVAIVLGLPSLSVILEGNVIAAVIVLVLAMVVVVLLLYIYRIATTSPYVFLENKVIFRFMDAEGKRATVRKEVKISPRQPNQEFYTFRNISCDGSMGNFRIDPELSLIEQRKESGDYLLTVRFPRKLRMFEKKTIWFEADIENCFLEALEGVITLIDQPTKKVAIEILFHKDRPPEADSVKSVYRYSGRDVEMEKPTVDSDRIYWEYSKKFRRIGYGHYEIMWCW